MSMMADKSGEQSFTANEDATEAKIEADSATAADTQSNWKGDCDDVGVTKLEDWKQDDDGTFIVERVGGGESDEPEDPAHQDEDDDNEMEAAPPAASLEQSEPADKPKRKPSKRFKKAPGAPKRFRSAFILFSQHKHKEIQEKLAGEAAGNKTEKFTTTSVAKLVSEEWRNMDAGSREQWDARARMDRERFEKEKLAYKGPWTVPIGHRKSKDPTAPKRPPSAFLSFSNSRRAAAKRNAQDATNAEISRILSKMWKEADQDVRKKYMDDEAAARAIYKVKIAEWRVEDEKVKKAEKKDPLQIYEESGGIGAYGLPDSHAIVNTKARKSAKKHGQADSDIEYEKAKRNRAGMTGLRGMNRGFPMEMPVYGAGMGAGMGGPSDYGRLQEMGMCMGTAMDGSGHEAPQMSGYPAMASGGPTHKQQLMMMGGAPNMGSGASNALQGMQDTSFGRGGGGDLAQHLSLRNQLSQLSNLELMQLSQQQPLGGGGMSSMGFGMGMNMTQAQFSGAPQPSDGQRADGNGIMPAMGEGENSPV